MLINGLMILVHTLNLKCRGFLGGTIWVVQYNRNWFRRNQSPNSAFPLKESFRYLVVAEVREGLTVVKVCESEVVIFSLAAPRSRAGNYWAIGLWWSIPVGREDRQREVSWCFNYDDIWKPWASLLSSKREAFIWLNQVKYIIWIALSKENISKVSFIRLGICKPSVCDSTWSKI